MSKFFIRRPIVAIVIAILTMVIGVVAMVTLPISQYPNIVPPEILVTATYPGADAKDRQPGGLDADRTADEWRRQHDLHGFRER